MNKVFVWMALLSIFVFYGCRTTSKLPDVKVQWDSGVYYIHEQKIIYQKIGSKPDVVLNITEIDRAKDALKVGDTMFILSEHGLYKVSLVAKSIALITQFASPVISGMLLAHPNLDLLIYAVDDRVGFYSIGDQTVKEVFSRSGSGFLKPLGLVENGRKLFLVSQSGDPEFPDVLSLDLNKGEIVSWPIGIGYDAALSPNTHYLAIASVQYAGLEKPPEYGLTLFDLFTSHTSEHILQIPNQPSHVHDLLWSLDSQRMYFLLRPGTPYDDLQTSYGIWGLSMEKWLFEQIVAIDDPMIHLIDITPDGEWILLRPEVESSVSLVHVPSGEIEKILLPQGETVLVHWQ